MELSMILDAATAFVLGIAVLGFLCWLLRFKLRSFFGLLISSIGGAIVLIALNIFNILTLPINPLNMLIVGALGIFGVVLIYLIITFI